MLDPDVVEPVLTVEVTAGPHVPRLVVTGDLDLDGAAKVLDRVIEEQGAAVEFLDLAGVEFIGTRAGCGRCSSIGRTGRDRRARVTRRHSPRCELAAVTFLLEEPETATS